MDIFHNKLHVKINDLNHNRAFEKDKVGDESQREREQRRLETHMHEEREKVRQSVLNPMHMTFNIRTQREITLLDPNHMEFNFRKK